MGFFSKDINFIVKTFWPYHSKAKGFSVENFPDKHGEEIPSFSSNKFSGHTNLKSIKRESNYIAKSNLIITKRHWANRDFSEYKEAA